MIFRESLKHPNVLNIFTDASIIQINDTYVSCPGYVAVTTNEDNTDLVLSSDIKILENSTNNNGEITAISMGIDYAISQMYNFQIINLFSDSKICIYGLREWIYNWVNNITPNMDTYIMNNSSGKPVANQSQILGVVNKIINNNLNICLYHQSGHVSGTQESIYEAMKIFKSTNYFTDPINYADIKYISLYNDFIDKLTRSNLENYTLQNSSLDKVVSYAYYQNLDIDKYAELTNRKLLKGRRI